MLVKAKQSTMKVRKYSELKRLGSFEERFEYLKLGGQVGNSTFGFDRWINQRFYSSWEWKNVRQYVIVRDNGCDLGVPDYEIHGDILIHHINPMSPDDIIHGEEWILNPDFLITTTRDTHNAIHYGGDIVPRKPFISRSAGDTRLW